MSNSFERKNNQIAASQVEENAFFNSDIIPEGQMAKLDNFDKKIEKIESKMAKNEELSHSDAGPDYESLLENQDLEDSLDTARINRDTLIHEGNKRIGIRNLVQINKIENSIKKYPHFDKNEDTKSKIDRLNKEIEKRQNYIENSGQPLDRATIKSIEEDIEKREDRIDSLIKSN